jgi:hypothetical protein
MHAKDILTNRYVMLFIFIILIVEGILSKLGSAFFSFILAVFTLNGIAPAAGNLFAQIVAVPYTSQVIILQGLYQFETTIPNDSFGSVLIIAGILTFFLSFLIIYDLIEIITPRPMKNLMTGLTIHHIILSIVILFLVIIIGSAVTGHFSLNPIFGFTAFLHAPSGFHQYIINTIKGYNSTTGVLV